MKRVFMLALIILCTLPGQSRADFTTADVTSASATLECLDWRVKGVCLKLKCSFFGCSVRTVPWIEHRIPDLVVSAYNNFGDIPWHGAKAIYGELAGTAGSAVLESLAGVAPGGTSSNPRRASGSASQSNVRSKEISIIGNPVLAALQNDNSYICSTDVEPMRGYFSSEVDGVAWRTGMTEQLYPATWVPGMRSIGAWPTRYWGGVHPRHGHVQQESDVLAAAVMAQRAVDIATRHGQPHIYRQVPGLAASDEKSDRWQMIHPREETDCVTFGEDANYHAGREHSSGPDEGDYGWIYWGLHDCCPGSGKTIAKIGS